MTIGYLFLIVIFLIIPLVIFIKRKIQNSLRKNGDADFEHNDSNLWRPGKSSMTDVPIPKRSKFRVIASIPVLLLSLIFIYVPKGDGGELVGSDVDKISSIAYVAGQNFPSFLLFVLFLYLIKKPKTMLKNT